MIMRTKKLNHLWYCYGTVKGYDYTFEGFTKAQAIDEAKLAFLKPYFDDVRNEIIFDES